MHARAAELAQHWAALQAVRADAEQKAADAERWDMSTLSRLSADADSQTAATKQMTSTIAPSSEIIFSAREWLITLPFPWPSFKICRSSSTAGSEAIFSIIMLSSLVWG